jgi:predicted cobalt transporter CbtA
MKKLICATFIGLFATAVLAQTDASQQAQPNKASSYNNTQTAAQSKQDAAAPAPGAQSQKSWGDTQNEGQNGQNEQDGQSN